MRILQPVVLLASLGLAGYWLYEFITTGTPEVLLAMATMVTAIFGGIVLPRVGKSSGKTPE
ncbi:hypothetical protein L5876_04890 [Hyphobacterium sp. SN044]|uniref:hypothetical protein n=1 Tax=Hyphobacterium sp. SN044 TaxID=2912575 RepID=UPI001F278B33|nr:hypothetical protein [Hyphobacterium sp. SN044]MCF8879148.1 hypothetical protein [Hyphobacterium sp. SN044]